MRDKIRKAVADYLSRGGKEVRPEDDMDLQADLGLSSLDMMTLIYAVEEETQTAVSFERLAGVRTLKQFYEAFEPNGE